jgi:hemerythrin-like metal-binding protein
MMLAANSHVLFAWKDEYSVQNPEMNLQHRRLMNLLNKLHEAMTNGQTNGALRGILGELVEYAHVHFVAEEELMLKIGYPRLAGHRLQHQELSREVRHFLQELDAGRVTIGIQLLQFLKQWLIDHILGSDRLYGAFLLRKRKT